MGLAKHWKEHLWIADSLLFLFCMASVLLVVVGIKTSDAVIRLNQGLFLCLNHRHTIAPLWLWRALNILCDPDHLFLMLCMLSFPFFKKGPSKQRVRVFLQVFFAIGLYIVLFWLIKHLAHAPRPYVIFPQGSFFLDLYPSVTAKALAKKAYASFPSGHAGLTALFICALNDVFFAKKRFWHWVIRILGFVLLVLVCLARIMTGWHFPLDVLCGVLLGYGVATLIFRTSITITSKERTM